MGRRGHTLIELIVAMILLGLLAAIATRAVTRRAAAAHAVLKSDLRNLAVAEEAYFSEHQAYTGEVEALQFASSKGVTIDLRADATGWAGRATHDVSPDYYCSLFLGRSVEPFSPAVEEGKIRCRPSGVGGSCSGG